MEELAIRRNRSFAAPQRQTVSRTEKQSAAAGTQKTVRGTGLSVSETLRQLMERVNQAAGHLRESRRTLQTGEGVLAEVQEKLGRMAELAEEASGEGADREALQAELEQLRGEVDRMLNSPSGAALFSDEGAESAEEAGASEGSAAGETVVPEWLLKAVAQGKLDADQILAALGLDKSASGADVLAALAGRLPENDPTAALLASLYLGAVISGGPNAGDMDPTMALDGLRLLLEKTAQGMPLDEAIRLLTNGEYTSLADFQEQFSGGAMPGLEEFLTNLLLTGGGNLLQEMEMPSLLTFMAGTGGMEMDLLMALMTAGEAQASAPEAGQENALAQNTAAEAAETVGSAGNSAAETAGMTGTAGTEGASGPMEVMRFGGLQVMGRDLSAVAYDEASGKLTIGGTADVTVRGAGEQTVEVTGSGTVTVQNLRATLLTVDSAGARIVTVGENTLGEVRLGQSTVLTLDGGGLLRAGTVRGGEHALLRMAGGALEVAEGAENGAPGILTVPVVLEGPASLMAQAATVRDAAGQDLQPFDILWQTFLPGFGAITAMEANGQHARMSLLNGEHSEALRLWLAKGDLSSHGYPAQQLAIRGWDEAGQPRTRYAYLQWDQRERRFREFSMYPNPFTVTGGEQDKDWSYEEETHTLRILSGQVTAISGGAGTDARQEPFSGRIDIQDGIGAVQLALGGVVCRVSSGRAFSLGRENDVLLLLPAGTTNIFESGEGCAGISLGAGTSLRVDCAPPGAGETAGTLTATGGAGSVGIGQDRDRSGHIMIRGGVVTSSGKQGAARSVTIAGSTSGGSDLGGAKAWTRTGVFLQMGEDAVILPQFPLSSRTLQLNKLRVSTREYARAARMTIDTDRRWVSQIQSAYSDLSNSLERSINGLDSASQYFGGPDGVVRDNTAARVLLREMTQSIPVLSYRAMQIHAKRSIEDVNHLFR